MSSMPPVGPPLPGNSAVVARGTSGRLFYDSYEMYNTHIAHAVREPLFPLPSLIRWQRLLETRARLLKKLGLPLYVLIAPDTHFIYRDEMPAHLPLPAVSPANQFCRHFSAIDNLTIINPEPSLIGARGGIDVCRVNDTHWSAYGAFVAYRALIEQLQPGTPMRQLTARDVSYRFVPSFGDLGAMIEPELVAKMPVASVDNGSSKLVSNLAGEGRNAWKRFESDRGTGHAFVIRDSFAAELGIFLSETFARVDYLGATSRLHLEAIEREKPDVVIWEVGERRLYFDETDHQSSTAYEIYAFDAATDCGILALEALDERAGGKLEGAYALARRAAEMAGSNPAYLFLLAEILVARSLFEEAGQVLGQAIALRDDRPAYWHALSVVSRHLGRPQAAIDASSRAASLAPYNAKYVADHGYNLLVVGRKGEAVEVMAEGRSDVSDSPHLCYWLASAYSQVGSLDAARQEVINANLLLPDNAQVLALMWEIESGR